MISYEEFRRNLEMARIRKYWKSQIKIAIQEAKAGSKVKRYLDKLKRKGSLEK